MRNTTLCYIERDGCWLMLHRVKKENDENRDKWIGIGGGIEEGESPEDGVRREVLEETGLTLYSQQYRGLITFVSDEGGTEYMHLFTSVEFAGELTDCDEGKLEWVRKEDVFRLPIWEGDRIFLKKILTDGGFFTLKLVYRGEKRTEAILNGTQLLI